MNKFTTAIAGAVTVPTAAHARTAPRPDCCVNTDKGHCMGMGMAKISGSKAMDHSMMDHEHGIGPDGDDRGGQTMPRVGALPPPVDAHQNHQQ